jgi:hypothetical protein
LVPGDMEIMKERDLTMRRYFSVVSIVLWFRFLQFFRVFIDTGQYIRMLFEVMGDMLQFMVIFLIIILSYSHAFFIIMKNNETSQLPTVWHSIIYVYHIALGEFQYDESFFGTGPQNIICWFLFVLSSGFLMIIMLNLLIAIIGDTFARNYGVMKYKEILHLIVENKYLNFGELK